MATHPDPAAGFAVRMVDATGGQPPTAVVDWSKPGTSREVRLDGLLGPEWTPLRVDGEAAPLEVRRAGDGTAQGRWLEPSGRRAVPWPAVVAPLLVGAAGAVASRLRSARHQEAPPGAQSLPQPGDARSERDPDASADEKTRDLLELQATQQHMIRAMLKVTAVRLVPRRDSTRAFERYAALARELLARTVAFNARWAGSFDVSTMVAQAFSQQLTMAADHAEAGGDHARAAAYRDEAETLRVAWVRGTASLEAERGEAMRLAATGDFNVAIVALERVRQAFAADGAIRDAAQTSLDLANLYEWLGDVERALEVVAKVRADIAPHLRDGPPTAWQVSGALLRQLSDLRDGSHSVEGEDALKLWRIANELLMQESRLRRHLGEYDAAGRLLREALDFAGAVGVSAGVEFQLAAVALGQGRLDEAWAISERIAPAFEAGLLRPRRAALRMQQADVLLARSDPRGALALVDGGIADLEVYPSAEMAWKLHWRRGRALAALRRDEEALAALLRAAASADTLRKSSLGYRLDSTYVREMLPMFEAGISIAAELGDAGAAARLIELIKSRALAATLSIPVDQRAHRTEDEQRFDRLSQELDALDYAQYRGVLTAEERSTREPLLAERTAVMERMRIADARWRGLSEPVPLDLGAVQATLERREAMALTLFHRPGRIVAVLLDGRQAHVAVRPLDPATESALVDYADNLRKREPDEWLYDLSEEREVGVTDLVPGALVDRAAHARSLIIVPHGVLHLVPWAALSAGDGRLLERSIVSVVPNLSCVTLLDGPYPPSAPIALIGDPEYSGLDRYHALTWARDEIDQVAGLYGPRVSEPPLVGHAATEDAVRRVITAPSLRGGTLHIACHGTLDAGDPMRSALLLSSSKLDAGEVAQTHLAADEIVLSACSTGWRPERVGGIALAGDDALGLPAAFLEAGARSILASVSKVPDDVAPELSVRYHGHRLAGLQPAEALNATQIELLHAGEHPPRSWLGMTSYGL